MNKLKQIHQQLKRIPKLIDRIERIEAQQIQLQILCRNLLTLHTLNPTKDNQRIELITNETDERLYGLDRDLWANAKKHSNKYTSC